MRTQSGMQRYYRRSFSQIIQQAVRKNEQLPFQVKDTQYQLITDLALSHSGSSQGFKLGDRAIYLIASAELPFINRLYLTNNNITHQGVKQLEKCKWKRIKRICLSNNPIKNVGVKQLVKNKWVSLRRINLNDIGLTDDGAKILAKGHWPKLRQIHLQQNHLTAEFYNSLIYSNWIRSTQIFWMRESDQKQLRGYYKNLKLYKLMKVQRQKQRIQREISKIADKQAEGRDQ